MEESLDSYVDKGLVKTYLFTAVIWLCIATTVGFLLSIKFWWPAFLNNIPYLAFPRLQMIHVNGVAFAWLFTGFFGISYYYVPRLTRQKLFWVGGAWILYFLWNFIVVAAVISFLLGDNKGLPYAEIPIWINYIVVVAVVIYAINIFGTIFTRRENQLYVSLWYLMAGIVWSALNYIIGNWIPYYWATGTEGAMLSGFYFHNVVGMMVTPLGLAIAYYVLPIGTDKPIYSHKLSIIGFFALAFIYPFTGAHHYLYSPIPRWVQTISIVTSVLLIIPVWVVITNFFGTMKGKWTKLTESIPVKFVILGSVFYLLTCFQGPMQSLRSMQKIIHFTDWVVGHAHMALYGAFSLFIFAGIYVMWPIISGKEMDKKLGNWHFWLGFVGFSIMAMVLWAAGLIQGILWIAQVPFLNTVWDIQPYWVIRTVAGAMMVLSFFVLLYNMWKTNKEAVSAD